jgi:glycosyltransferase involved in cell wall biosynthesis
MIPNTIYSLMHILNLDTIGGVETLYLNFLRHVWKKDPSLHITCISGKKINPLYQKVFNDLRCTPFYERKLFGLFLPKPLRALSHIRRWMLTDVSKASLLVFWNRIEKSSPSFPFLYYEHGASWNLQSNRKPSSFFEQCKGAICVSEAAKFMLQHKVPNSFPIHVLPNPLRPDISLSLNPKQVPTGKIHLGFIGRLLPIKAPALTILTLYELIHVHRLDVCLTIAGIGKEKPFLLNLIKQLHLESHVTCLDKVEQIEQFYDSIDILLIPSVREPLGLVALEASARGVPIVATCVDGLHESVRDGFSGILVQPTLPLTEQNARSLLASLDGIPEVVFDPIEKKLVEPKLPSPSDFAKAVVRVLQPDLFSKLSEGGIEYARTRAQFDTWCSSLLSIFRTAVEDLAISDKEEENEQIDSNS